MEPTPFAEQLAESITYGLGMIHSALNQGSTFEPATSSRSFVIGMTDIGEIYFLPKLMDRLRRDASGVTVGNTAANLRDDMEAGKVDLAIGLLPQLKAAFFQRRLSQIAPYLAFGHAHRFCDLAGLQRLLGTRDAMKQGEAHLDTLGSLGFALELSSLHACSCDCAASWRDDCSLIH